MKTLTTIVLIYIAAIFVITSCKKSDSTPTTTVITKSGLPMKIGNWWRYLHRDGSNGYIDTLTLTIIGHTSQPGTEVWTCLEHEGAGIDTAYFSVTDSVFSFYSNGVSKMGQFAAPLPVDTNNKKSVFFSDYFSVVGYYTGFDLLGHQYNVYDVYATGGIGSVTLHRDVYLTKDIGLVGEHYTLSSDYYSTDLTDALIDYHLN